MVKESLSTERLTLRLASPEDGALAAEFQRENREWVQPWSPLRDESFFTESYWHDKLTAESGGTHYRFWVYRGEALVASVNLHDVRLAHHRCAEIGYAVDYRHQGKGFATEAAEALLDFAFDELGLHRVEATYMPSNRASARVLDKLGFTPEGLLREILLIDGRWEDHVIASLLRSEVRPHG
jgi:ribosomal-protein-alanine N-acetyltransferase